MIKPVLRFLGKHLAALIVVVVLLIISAFVIFASPNEDGSRTFSGQSPTYTDAQEQAYCEAKENNDKALAGLTGINVPQDSTSGCDPTDLPQMGSLTYYSVPMATPTEFYNSVNGKGFNEGYGLQCVAAFKEFTYSLSGKYVAAAGGGAKGYATQQSQIEPLGFKWYSGTSGLQDGDWAIWTNGQYGHVAMKYGDKWFSQNQYAADPNRGNAFNLASISTTGIAGYYRPNIYVNVAPPDGGGSSGNNGGEDVSNVGATYTVQSGDTLGGISLNLGWWPSVTGLYGDTGYAQRLAEFNGIQNRGVIYPSQVIKKAE